MNSSIWAVWADQAVRKIVALRQEQEYNTKTKTGLDIATKHVFSSPHTLHKYNKTDNIILV